MVQARKKAVRRRANRKVAKTKPLKVNLYYYEGNDPFPPMRKAYRGYIKDIVDILGDLRGQLKELDAERVWPEKLLSISEIRKELEKAGWHRRKSFFETYYLPRRKKWVKLAVTTEPYPLSPGAKYIDLTEDVGTLYGAYPVVRLTHPFNSGR